MLEVVPFHLQGLLPRLLSQIQEVFPLAMLYTPADHAQRSTGDWPTAQSLVDAGKRIVWLSGVDYGPAMADVIFSKYAENFSSNWGWGNPYFLHAST